MVSHKIVTQERLQSLISYCPTSGVFKWKIARTRGVVAGSVAGTDRHGYIVISIDGGSFYAHRLAFLLMTGAWPSGVVDHINGDRSDNRWGNLRDVPHFVNMQNLKKSPNSSSIGLLGVTRWRGKFKAQIRVGGKNYNLGTFNIAEEAHQRYLEEKRKLHEGCTL